MRDRAENRIMIGAVMVTVDFTEGFWEGMGGVVMADIW